MQPKVYIRAGFAGPNKEAPFLHLKRKLIALLKSANDNGGVSHFSVVYDTPERLHASVQWMKSEGRKAFPESADMSVFTDTNTNGRPRMWVELILNNADHDA